MFVVGQKVWTKWSGRGEVHTVIAVHDNHTSNERIPCQSGKLIQVSPPLKDLQPKDWIDIGWFHHA